MNCEQIYKNLLDRVEVVNTYIQTINECRVKLYKIEKIREKFSGDFELMIDLESELATVTKQMKDIEKVTEEKLTEIRNRKFAL